VPDDDRPDGVILGTPEDDAEMSRGRHDDPEKPPPSTTPPADGGDDSGDDGGEGIVALAPETAGLVASGANLDAVMGRSDAVPASKTGTAKPKASAVVIEFDD
jgi:hypothetical protein